MGLIDADRECLQKIAILQLLWHRSVILVGIDITNEEIPRINIKFGEYMVL